jgi:hypothetical protein
LMLRGKLFHPRYPEAETGDCIQDTWKHCPGFAIAGLAGG